MLATQPKKVRKRVLQEDLQRKPKKSKSDFKIPFLEKISLIDKQIFCGSKFFI